MVTAEVLAMLEARLERNEHETRELRSEVERIKAEVSTIPSRILHLEETVSLSQELIVERITGQLSVQQQAIHAVTKLLWGLGFVVIGGIISLIFERVVSSP